VEEACEPRGAAGLNPHLSRSWPQFDKINHATESYWAWLSVRTGLPFQVDDSPAWIFGRGGRLDDAAGCLRWKRPERRGAAADASWLVGELTGLAGVTQGLAQFVRFIIGNLP
jgi:hypothetical protein